MKLSSKKILDYYFGGFLIAIIRPFAALLYWLNPPSSNPVPPKKIGVIKMMGGGSMIIALPMLLGIKKRYPEVKLYFFTTKAVKSFGETLGIFDEIITFDDENFVSLMGSSVDVVFELWKLDTIIDLEVFSRLTAIVTFVSFARNRVGFYLEHIFWRKKIFSHLIFFNRLGAVFNYYERIGHLFDAKPVERLETREHLMKFYGVSSIGPIDIVNNDVMVLGHACSDLARERILSPQQWCDVLKNNIPAKVKKIIFLGISSESKDAEKIILELKKIFPTINFENMCGATSLLESIRIIITSKYYFGIDSALLHYARIFRDDVFSVFGPTSPYRMLKPENGLVDKVLYVQIPCSPCVHVSEQPPCNGKNICIQASVYGQNLSNSTIPVIT